MTKEFKIYTRGGDKGETSLLGGSRVPKYHPRIEAYGTLDELASNIGLIRDQEIDAKYKEALIRIQNILFTAEALLASDKPADSKKLPQLTDEDVLFLEQGIDRMNESLPPISSFILPGGHPTVSYCHIARTICRRSERLCIKLAEAHPVDEIIIRFLNRLSDYLFVLSRKLSADLHAVETPWKPYK